MGSMVRKLSPLFLKVAGLGLILFLAASPSPSFAQGANVFANPDQLARLLQEEGLPPSAKPMVRVIRSFPHLRKV